MTFDEKMAQYDAEFKQSLERIEENMLRCDIANAECAVLEIELRNSIHDLIKLWEKLK